MSRNVITGTYVKNGETFDFNFFTDLRVTDKVRFINFVCNIVVGDNYIPVLRDLIFDFAIVDVFTDVDTAEILEKPNSLYEIEMFLEENDIVSIVKANIKDGLLEELNKAVDDSIEYKTGIHRSTLSSAVEHLIKTVEEKFKTIDAEGMMQLATKLSGMTDELTMDKLLEAYSKTDIFKNKVEKRNQERQEHLDELDKIVSSGKAKVKKK